MRILARGLKANLVGAREGTYPEALDAATGQRVSAGECWRGGGFNMAHRDFFTAGKQYRVPGFLATSPRQEATKKFMRRAEQAGYQVVQWRLVFDPRGDPRGADEQDHRCKHMSKLRVTHFPNECEFPFQAYSPFTVIAADFTTACRDRGRPVPHHDARARHIDGILEDERLPLTPWF